MPETRYRRRLIVAVVVVAAALLLVGAGFVTSQPAVCASCHGAEAKSTAAGSHGDQATCYGCHLENGAWSIVDQKAREWFVMYPHAPFAKDVPNGPVIRTSRSACLSCHSSEIMGVTESNGLRIDHSVCAADVSCDTCHTSAGHGRARVQRGMLMEDCTACHRRQDASVECDTCHDGKITKERLSAGPWRVTHGPDWEKMHGMGRLDSCQTCHKPEYCTRCHGVPMPHAIDFGSTHGTFAKKDDKTCRTCHKSATFCSSCHGIEMPHPATFLQRHSNIAKGDNDPACKRCHAPDDCDKCHTYHVHPGFATQQLSGAKAGDEQ